MTWPTQQHSRLWTFLPGLLLVAVLAGCATTPKIDWNGRVGNYTYDQAVMDFGPPDKYARLTDGSSVAEWMTRQGYHRAFATMGYSHPPYYGFYGPLYPSYWDSYYPSQHLRLIFGADAVLRGWKNFSR